MPLCGIMLETVFEHFLNAFLDGVQAMLHLPTKLCSTFLNLSLTILLLILKNPQRI